MQSENVIYIFYILEKRTVFFKLEKFTDSVKEIYMVSQRMMQNYNRSHCQLKKTLECCYEYLN